MTSDCFVECTVHCETYCCYDLFPMLFVYIQFHKRITLFSSLYCSHQNQSDMLLEKKTLQVIHLSLAFMLIFSAFNTFVNIQELVIKNIQKDDSSFTGSGYVSLAIIYIVFAICNWISPSVLSVFGPNMTMVIGATTYVIFIACYFWPQTWLLYLSSALVGVGAAFLWTASGNFLTLVSDEKTMGRNSGIFWSILSTNFLFGNLFVYYEFQGQQIIRYGTRVLVYGVLIVVGCLGVVLLVLLPKPEETSAESGRQVDKNSPLEALLKSLTLWKTRSMILLSFTFFYTGLCMSFITGVYSVSISFTMRFSDAKSLVGLSGICIGCGEIIGGAVFGICGKKIIKAGRDPVVILGYLTNTLCFFLIFLNIPSAAPFGDTNEASYFADGMPSKSVALLCSFLLGFGDACYNTQILSILGSIYAKNSGPAFALFKFTQALGSSTCFFYASVLELNWQLLILLICATLGTLSFCSVEWNEYRRKIQRDRMELNSKLDV